MLDIISARLGRCKMLTTCGLSILDEIGLWSVETEVIVVYHIDPLQAL